VDGRSRSPPVVARPAAAPERPGCQVLAPPTTTNLMAPNMEPTSSGYPETIRLASLQPTNVVIYEYGARIDDESEKFFHDQAFKAHRLYNAIVESMQATVAAVHEALMAEAGPRAAELDALIQAEDGNFKQAKAANDAEGMKAAARRRRELRPELWALLADARKRTKEAVKPIYARVGLNSTCETYKLRSAAVEQGLGWATANAVLQAAMNAWKKTIKMGRAPRFAKFSEKLQHTLTLQFTVAGGLSAEHLLAGRHQELVITPPAEARRKRYGEFLFRVGPAKNHEYIKGTWQYHRPIPEGSSIGLVRLVGRRHAGKFKFSLQFMVKLPEPVRVEVERKNPEQLVAVHLGWAACDDGRKVAGITYAADPGMATLLRLPPDIEADIRRSDDLRGQRDLLRNEVVANLRSLTMPGGASEPLEAELVAIVAQRKLKPEHIPPSRLYRLMGMLQKDPVSPDISEALAAWARRDRKLHQAADGIGERARNRRQNYYREAAINLIRSAEVVALQELDLAAAAEKIDKETGERSEFNAAARRGRVAAALSELTGAIEWACNKTGTPLVLVTGEQTVSTCAYCGGQAHASDQDWQMLTCTSCGAVAERKLAAAARLWQLVSPHRPALMEEFAVSQEAAWTEAVAKQNERKDKMAEARRANRMQNANQELTA